MHIRLFEHDDELQLSLATHVKPLATNGRWDEVNRGVKWQRSIVANDTLPTMCFALWAQPDVVFQEKHFGKVLLTGASLAEFVSTYSILDAEDQKLVDQFIEGLTAERDLKGPIDAFVKKYRKREGRGDDELVQIGKLLSTAVRGK